MQSLWTSSFVIAPTSEIAPTSRVGHDSAMGFPQDAHRGNLALHLPQRILTGSSGLSFPLGADP